MVFANKKEDNYQRTFEEDRNYFKKYTGVFTNIINASNKNGNVIQPFGNNNNKFDKHKPKADKEEIQSPRSPKNHNLKAKIL